MEIKARPNSEFGDIYTVQGTYDTTTLQISRNYTYKAVSKIFPTEKNDAYFVELIDGGVVVTAAFSEEALLEFFHAFLLVKKDYEDYAAQAAQ